MKRYTGEWDPKWFREIVDAEMQNVTLSDDIVRGVMRAAHAQPRGLIGWIVHLLTREVVIPIPHLAVSVAVLIVAAGIYWNQTFNLSEQLLAMYQKLEITCTPSGCLEKIL